MIFHQHRQDGRNDGAGLRQARGFSLVSAIFLLVVLAMLGVAMVAISTVQNQSSGLDVQGVRAYQAARAGIEWGLYQELQPPNSCVAATNIAMPAGTSLSGFTVTVTCTADTGLGLSINNWAITAVACNMPTAGACVLNTGPTSSDFVQRVVQVQF